MTTSATDSETIQLGSSSAIHVGPILTSGSNESISIVIPLSAQVATVADRVDLDEARAGSASNDYRKDYTSVAVKSGLRLTATSLRGCPLPTCSRYGRAFSRAHDLKRHIARHEAKKERVLDIIDGGADRCARLLEEHELRERMDHSQEELQVSVCDLFKKRHGYEKKIPTHLETHSKKSISNVCALCGLRFNEYDELQVHMKVHTGITGTRDAKSALEGVGSLTQIRDVEDEIFEDTESSNNMLKKASACSVQPANTEVVVGPNRNTKNNTSDKIRCDYCWKTFKSKWTLNSHVAAHEGRFQFDCDRCGKRFVRKSHFEGHMRSHEATRPYACDLCGSTFKQVKHRREHVKRKHVGTQNAVQSLLDSISGCVSEESSVDQPQFTILVPVDFDQIN